jgi:protein ImuA
MHTVFQEHIMALAPSAQQLETLHPSLWRASQLARGHTPTVDTGFPSLSRQLPGGGWPKGTLVDLLVQQPGIGEMRLVAPALTEVAERKVILVQPPHAPQALALAGLGVPPESAIWLRPERTADALWAAEQVLRSGSCGALLFWPGQSATSSARQQHVRADSLRRLHLAAQQGETLFFLFRPLGAEVDASPAPLRLSVRPAPGGINVGFVKRQGPQRDEPLFLPMSITQARHIQPQRQGIPDRVVSVPAAARGLRADVT